MADEQIAVPQKRTRGRPRKQQVVATPEAPVSIAIESAPPAQSKKTATTVSTAAKTKKIAVAKKETEPAAVVEKKSKKTIKVVRAAATTKSKAAAASSADHPPTIAASAAAPPSSAPQEAPTTIAQAAANTPSRKLKEAPEKPPATPKAAERATSTQPHPSDSKILSALAAQNALPLQQQNKTTKEAAPLGPQPATAAEKKGRKSETPTSEQQTIEPQDRETKGRSATTSLSAPQQRNTSSPISTPAPPLPAATTPSATEPATPLAEQKQQQPACTTTTTTTTTTTIPPSTTAVAAAALTTEQPPAAAAAKPTTTITATMPAVPKTTPRRQQPPPPPPPAQPYRAPQAAPPPPHPRAEWKPVEPLPAKYKPAARRVTLAMVAAPIAIVTSWVLYDRLVLGNERKVTPQLIPSLAGAVEDANKADATKKEEDS